ncbi:hypothetical protein NX059_006706 [Plenodomus lindquistii]|nr:hypothetical protein NX059_006706 [Plenodomus lindquistii]
MFTADLSWADSGTEKVGERRERKARERTTPTASINTSNSSRGSTSADRELWWTSGLRKAKELKPKLSVMRPKTGHSATSEDTAPRTKSRSQSMVVSGPVDQNLQPGWTCPSRTPLEPPRQESPESEVPELEGDTSSRHTNSTEPHQYYDARFEVKTPLTVRNIDDSYQGYHISPTSVIPQGIPPGSVATDRDSYVDTSDPRVVRYSKGIPQQVTIEGAASVETLHLRNSEDVNKSVTSENPGSISKGSDRPLSQWDSLSPRGIPTGLRMRPESAVKAAPAQKSTLEPNRFQRFILRMESASSKIVLDRLKEDWSTSGEIDEELVLEKQLWLLTGFRMQGSGNRQMAPRPQCDTGRVLELYGNLSEVHQLSALHPTQSVHFLTTQRKRPGALPSNVSYLTVREHGAVPLPYPEEFFSHIRAPTLPSLVPSAKIPELFRECFKLLAPGGLLELRVMDAAPLRNVAGPLMRMWIEDRLSINLERLFRCSKPCMLVPHWLADVGFDVVSMEGDESVKLPCVFDAKSSDVNHELSTIVGQSLWKDVWGAFVDDIPGEPKWFWEDEDIVRECRQRRTVFECKTIMAYRR